MADFQQRLEQEKLAALKELAYGAGHEINNPLANIAARAQTLLEDEPHPERRRKLTAIHRQGVRGHGRVAALMLFARPPALELAECDLRLVVRRVVAELGDLAAERQIELTCDAGDASRPPVLLGARGTQLAGGGA